MWLFKKLNISINPQREVEPSQGCLYSLPAWQPAKFTALSVYRLYYYKVKITHAILFLSVYFERSLYSILVATKQNTKNPLQFTVDFSVNKLFNLSSICIHRIYVKNGLFVSYKQTRNERYKHLNNAIRPYLIGPHYFLIN